MVEADLQALGLTTPNGKALSVIRENAFIRQDVGSLMS